MGFYDSDSTIGFFAPSISDEPQKPLSWRESWLKNKYFRRWYEGEPNEQEKLWYLLQTRFMLSSRPLYTLPEYGYDYRNPVAFRTRNGKYGAITILLVYSDRANKKVSIASEPTYDYRGRIIRGEISFRLRRQYLVPTLRDIQIIKEDIIV